MASISIQYTSTLRMPRSCHPLKISFPFPFDSILKLSSSPNNPPPTGADSTADHGFFPKRFHIRPNLPSPYPERSFPKREIYSPDFNLHLPKRKGGRDLGEKLDDMSNGGNEKIIL